MTVGPIDWSRELSRPDLQPDGRHVHPRRDDGESLSLIPKIIHQMWYQGISSLPEKYRRYQASWQRHHPDWSFRFWDGPALRSHIADHQPWYREKYESLASVRERMNVARYCLLGSLGGFYVDMDIECLRPIDVLLHGHDLILSKTAGYNCAIMGGCSAHVLWQTIFDNLRDGRTASLDNEPPWLRSSSKLQIAASVGPRFFDMSVRQSGAATAPGTLNCPGYFFEPGSPGSGRRKHEIEDSFGRHDMDMTWLSPSARVLAKLSAVVLPTLVDAKSRVMRRRTPG
jgi:mannosyltransferase OCH1-like enzyme